MLDQNTVDGVERIIEPHNPTIETVSALYPANRPTTGPTKSTLPQKKYPGLLPAGVK